MTSIPPHLTTRLATLSVLMTAPLHQRAGSASSSTSPIVPSPSSSTSSTQSQQEIEDSQRAPRLAFSCSHSYGLSHFANLLSSWSYMSLSPSDVLVDTAVSILDQGQDLVANTLNDDQFTFESRLVAGSTIGKHLRAPCSPLLSSRPVISRALTPPSVSSLSTFWDVCQVTFLTISVCSLRYISHPYIWWKRQQKAQGKSASSQAIESGSATLNYDVRKRQTPIETSTSSAREAIKDLQRRLQTLSEPPVPVQDGGLGREWLNVEVALSAQTPALISMKSTFGREVSGGHTLKARVVLLLTMNGIVRKLWFASA